MILSENRYPLFGIMRVPNQRKYATRRTRLDESEIPRLPFIKDALARRFSIWKGRRVSEFCVDVA
jgi:hypothetical protein